MQKEKGKQAGTQFEVKSKGRAVVVDRRYCELLQWDEYSIRIFMSQRKLESKSRSSDRLSNKSDIGSDRLL